MEKVIKIADKSIRLKSNGCALLIYKREFGKDLLKDLIALCGSNKAAESLPNIDISEIDTEAFFRIVYIFAKIADPDIGTLEEWLCGYEYFPIVDVMKEVLPFITDCITVDASLKKQIATASLKRMKTFSKRKKSFWQQHKRA